MDHDCPRICMIKLCRNLGSRSRMTIRDWNIRRKWNKITRKTNLSIFVRFNREMAINSLYKVLP